jgi:pimeloyl-ACP methyl ester carboxylesterase
VRVDEHTIEIAGTPVFHRSAPAPGGAADAPVLYLHGAPTSSDDWLPFLELTGGIAPDLTGFGRSGKAGHLEYTLEGHADFLELLLSELNVGAVRLVAHDWGAGGGLVFAQRDPDRVRRLVLIDALPLLDGFAYDRLGRIWRRPAIGELVMGSITRWMLARRMRRGCVDPAAWPDARLAAVWEQFDQGTQRAILRLHRSAGPEQLAAAGARLEQLGMPALVVWGEQDPWFAAAFADTYASRLPDATATRVAGAGHWPWLDQPAVVQAVASFLDAE